MNRSEDHIHIGIPASRKAFSDWFNAEHNKRLIYYIALGAWLVLFVFMESILPLTATSEYRVAFYLPLAVFMLALGGTTHFLIQAALADFAVRNREQAMAFYAPTNDINTPHIVQDLDKVS